MFIYAESAAATPDGKAERRRSIIGDRVHQELGIGRWDVLISGEQFFKINYFNG